MQIEKLVIAYPPFNEPEKGAQKCEIASAIPIMYAKDESQGTKWVDKPQYLSICEHPREEYDGIDGHHPTEMQWQGFGGLLEEDVEVERD